MARNDTINLPAGIWVQLTNANATSIRATNDGLQQLKLQATAGDVPPASDGGATILYPGKTFDPMLLIATWWGGVAGANRVWAFCQYPTVVSVSHADA